MYYNLNVNNLSHHFQEISKNLQRTTNGFVIFLYPPVCPSVRMEELDFRLTECHEISYLSAFLRKSVERI